jgi:cytochrome c oxidase subunit 2
LIGSANLSSWFPEAASAGAQAVDGPFRWVYIAGVMVLVLYAGAALLFFRLYRRQGEDQTGAPGARVHPLLLGVWVLGALGLAGLAFTSGFSGFIDRNTPPYGAYNIDVTARQGGWEFVYPNGHVADTLHVAADRPVQLTLRSADVNHGLSIPALRVNQAVVPGRTTRAWFEADQPGTYDLRSNVFSGDEFTAMNTAVVIHGDGEFASWLDEVSDIFIGRTMAEVGELLYTKQGCAVCHSIDGSKLVGPSFKNVYGYEFDTVAGVRVIADEAYIRESILEPAASIIAGYQPVMVSYAGVLDDRDIEALTAWLKTLSDKGGTDNAEMQEEN